MNLAKRSFTTTPTRIGHEHRQLSPSYGPFLSNSCKPVVSDRASLARPARVVQRNGTTKSSEVWLSSELDDPGSTVQQIEEEAKAKLRQRTGDAASEAGSGSGNGAEAGGQPLQAGRSEAELLRAKLKNAISVMQEGLVERDVEVRLLLLAAMAGEHILLIGPPGTAKSEVGRRLNTLIDGTYFERLLTRFSVPEELFGPLSMRALEEDQYIRQVGGYLPTAEVAFIDEIFKANSAILNTLLTLINERLFDNGNKRVPVPLISMVGASNELPESEELDALYDRFLVRRKVQQVSPTGVAQMLSYYSGPEGAAAAAAAAAAREAGSAGAGAVTLAADMRLTREDIVRCKAAALREVRVPQNVVQIVVDLRKMLQSSQKDVTGQKTEPQGYVSDRRLVKAIQLLQVAAYCNGRKAVNEYDCLLLQHVLWQRPEQAESIQSWIMSRLSENDGASQVEFLLKGLFSRACRAYANVDNAEQVKAIQAEAAELEKVLDEKFKHINEVLGGDFTAVLDNLWLGPEEGEAAATALQPRMKKSRDSVEKVLDEVRTLCKIVQPNMNPVELATSLPKYWADYVRHSPMNEVQPLGTTPLAGGAWKP